MTTTNQTTGDSTPDEPVRPNVFERLYDKAAYHGGTSGLHFCEALELSRSRSVDDAFR